MNKSSGSLLEGEVNIDSRSRWFALLWRFSPDLLLIPFGVLVSPVGELNSNKVGSYLYYMAVPSVFLLYVTIAFIQTGEARRNFSRYILEGALFNFLGYCSYTLYILQIIFCEFYYRIFLDDVHHHAFPYVNDGQTIKSYRKPFGWFRVQSNGIKIGGIVLLIAICFVVQNVFQDRMIASLYTYFLTRLK